MSQSVESISSPPAAAAALPALGARRAEETSLNTIPAPPVSGGAVARPWPWISTWVVLGCVAAVLSSGLVVAVHGTRGFFLPVVAVLVCLLAALFDGCTARIPNPLTYPAIVLGLALNGMVPVLEWMNGHAAVVWLGVAGPTSSLEGFGACAILGIVGCLAAGVHGGDLKLLAGVGALLGLLPTANALIVALLVALAYALLNLALFGRLNTVVRVGAMRVLEFIYLRRFETPVPEEEGKGAHIPMAVPLAVGLVAAQVWRMRTGGGVL